MSYENPPRHAVKHNLKKFLHRYGAPLGIMFFIVLAALYILVPGRVGDFPRSRGEFLAPDRAEERLEELAARLHENPGDIRALDESGRLKFQLGKPRYVEAIADLEKARSLGLADPRSFYYLGVMYQAVGLYDFSAQEYRRFLNNFPEDREVRMLLAKLYYADGDHAGAVREYEALLRDGSGDHVLLENLALALWKDGQEYSGVLKRLRSGGEEGDFLADYAEGRIRYEEEDHAGALPLLASAAAAAPSAGAFADRASLFWMAADSAFREKDLEAAAGYLAELLKASPGHKEGKRLLGRVEKARVAAARASKRGDSRK